MFDDLKKQARGGSSTTGRSGPAKLLYVADPRARILIMVVAFVILVGIAIGLQQYASSPEAQKGIADVPSKKLADLAGDAGADSIGVPTLDPSIADKIADRGPEARRRWEDKAIRYLLIESTVPAVYAYNRTLWPVTPQSVEQIAGTGEGQGSRPWRFKFVRFRGELEYIEEQDYEATYGADPEFEIGRVQRGRVRLEEGGETVRITFVTRTIPTWTDLNEISSEVQQIRDGWVRGTGILVKNFIDEHDGEAVPSILVVATRFERDYPAIEIDRLDQIDYGTIVDAPELAEEAPQVLQKLFPRPLFRLVQYAGKRAGPEHAARRAEEGLVVQNFDSQAGIESLLGNPAAHRGNRTYVGGRGVLAIDPELYDYDTTPPNDAGIDEFLFGWIYTDRQFLLMYAAPASLHSEELKMRTQVDYEGFFYKARAYPAKDGKDHVVPMLVLTSLERVPDPEPNITFQVYIALGFILGGVVLVWVIVREDRVKQDYRRQRKSRRVPEPDEVL